MSSTLAHAEGVKAFGADNILKNQAVFVKKSGQVVKEFAGLTLPEDFRTRDGSSASWISVSGSTSSRW